MLEAYLGPSRRATHGERVVTGQRRLQAASDVLLGWTTGPSGRHMYIRQLQDQKAGAVKVMTERPQPNRKRLADGSFPTRRAGWRAL